MKSFLVQLIFILPLLSGCRTAVDPDKVVVTVNGTPILEKQVLGETDYRINVEAARDATKGLTYDESSRDATRAYLRDEVLHTMIERLLIADQLKADHLEITEAEVGAQLIELAKKHRQTLEQAKVEIKKEGQTVAGVKEGLRQTIGVEKLYAAHAKDTNDMTVTEAREFYNENPHYFERPEERRVSRILIRVTPDATSKAKAIAQAKAEAVFKKVKAGEDFSTLAKVYSEDNMSKVRGGDRGWSTCGWITSTNSDPFGNIAFAMKKVGDISGVVKTQDGYDIIKLTGLKPARELTFKEVEQQIMAEDKYRKIGTFWNDYGEGLWAKAEIKWSPEEKARRVREEKEEKKFQEKMKKEAADENAQRK